MDFKGLDYNEENIKLLEYDMDFEDELKKKINEGNLLSLIKDGNEIVSSKYENKKYD